MNLYWVTTIEGYEDWFAVAKTKKAAKEFHEASEGFNPGDADAEFVCKIPPSVYEKFRDTNEREFWPSHELIRALGGKLDSEDNPRIVNFNGKIYIEGTFTEKMFFNDVGEACGLYIIKVQNTQRYKIGITTNIKRRITQLHTGNPFNIKLVYFVETKHYKSLEKHFHTLFKKNRIRGEWFNFSDEELEEVEANLFCLIKSSQFKIYNIKAVSIQGRVY